MKVRFVSNLIMAFSLMLGSTFAQAAMITYYNNLTDWEDAAGSSISESFTGNATDPAVSFTSSNGSGSVTSNQWQDQVNSGSGANTYIDFNYVTGGFGGNWSNLLPSGPSAGISLIVTFADGTTQDLSLQVATMLNDSFFGFMSDTAISSISLAQGSLPAKMETYWLDLVVAGDIPEPQTIALLGVGLLVFSLFRRKQKY